MHFPVGVLLDSFRLPLEQALDYAVTLGIQGVQINAVQGETSLAVMNSARKRELLAVLKDRGLAISAVCGDFGRGFDDANANIALIEQSKRIIAFARDLGVNIVTTHIGVIPERKDHPRYALMQDACGALADFAQEMDARFAVETGPETALTLKHFLDGLHSGGMAVNMDPANLVMVTGDDPAEAVHSLKDYIVHTHVKDGKRLYIKDPELIYGIKREPVVTDPSFIELPLGKGDVPFTPYLQALSDIGFQGYLTIEREVGNDPCEDIAEAVRFLHAYIK